MSDEPAFEVIMADGYAYRIWADGRIEGFEGDPVIINRIPSPGKERSVAHGSRWSDGAMDFGAPCNQHSGAEMMAR